MFVVYFSSMCNPECENFNSWEYFIDQLQTMIDVKKVVKVHIF